jgi:hypothetical protein
VKEVCPVKRARKIDCKRERARYSSQEGITKRPIEGFKKRKYYS